MDDGDSWCFDTESSARYQMNSSAFPDGSLFSQGFLSERSENPTTPCEGDNSGELERSLDEALAADDDDLIKYNLPTSPSLPAFSEVTNEWLQRPMSTGEACLNLQEIMTGSGFNFEDAQKLGCHSLKCTMLSWLAMGSYAGISDRRLAGHHLDPNNVSPVTYSRDELTRV